jgi:hypothetical protein
VDLGAASRPRSESRTEFALIEGCDRAPDDSPAAFGMRLCGEAVETSRSADCSAISALHNQVACKALRLLCDTLPSKTPGGVFHRSACHILMHATRCVGQGTNEGLHRGAVDHRVPPVCAKASQRDFVRLACVSRYESYEGKAYEGPVCVFDFKRAKLIIE